MSTKPFDLKRFLWHSITILPFNFVVASPRLLSVIGLSVALSMAPVAATLRVRALEVASWQFDAAAQQLELEIPEGITPSYFLLAQPTRIVLDLPNTVSANLFEEKFFPGAVRSIRVSQFQPNLTRIVIELAPGTELSSEQVELQHLESIDNTQRERWLVRPLLMRQSTAIASIEPVPSSPVPVGMSDLSNPNQPTEPIAIGSDVPTSIPSDSTASDSEVEINEVEINEVEINESDALLPPLEPGAVEIPIELPPTLPDLVELESAALSISSDGSLNEAASPESESDEEAESNAATSWSVEILPEATVATEETLEGVNGSAENVSESDSSDQSTIASEIPRVRTPRTPGELFQRLEESLPSGTPISIVSNTDTDFKEEQREPNELDLDTLDAATVEEAIASEPNELSDNTSLDLAPILEDESQIEAIASEPNDSPADISLDLAPILEDGSSASDLSTEDIDILAEVFSESAEENSSQEEFPSGEESRSTEGDNIISNPHENEPHVLTNDQQDSTEIPVSFPGATDNTDLVSSDTHEVELEITEASTDGSQSEDNNQPSFSEPAATELETLESDLAESQDSNGGLSATTATNSDITNTTTPESLEISVISPIQGASDRQLTVTTQPGSIIPPGTVLRLRYPRLTPTLLQKETAWQDVLLLEQTIRDTSGNIIADEGAQVIGRFELTPESLRFVSQAIALNGQNIPLQAISSWVPISTESQSVMIHPNQIVNVRVSNPSNSHAN